jgi:hypothetical protein
MTLCVSAGAKLHGASHFVLLWQDQLHARALEKSVADTHVRCCTCLELCCCTSHGLQFVVKPKTEMGFALWWHDCVEEPTRVRVSWSCCMLRFAVVVWLKLTSYSTWVCNDVSTTDWASWLSCNSMLVKNQHKRGEVSSFVVCRELLLSYLLKVSWELWVEAHHIKVNMTDEMRSSPAFSRQKKSHELCHGREKHLREKISNFQPFSSNRLTSAAAFELSSWELSWRQ